jgi:phosphatidylserine/phosphatidylglycerophosphate/cardiolipin synthase-like enzyme
MDGLLDTLTPLASLLSRTASPSLACAALATALDSGQPAQLDEALRHCLGSDAAAARAALDAARIPEAIGEEQRIRLAQAEVLALQIQRERLLAPALAMTVPDFLRQAWAEYLRDLPAADWPRETLAAMLDIAATARRELLLAAPFFDAGHARALAGPVARLTARGGHVLLVTQEARGSGQERNRASVRLLRNQARDPGQVDVWSWPGPTLGIHFKALVADRRHGYLGSANLTTNGALHHAEAGVILHGPLARQVDGWIRKVAAHPVERHGMT